MSSTSRGTAGSLSPLAGPAQHPPGGIGAQGLAVLGRCATEPGGHPSLEPGQHVVALGEDAVSDEEVAQVVGGPGTGVVVQGLVGEGQSARSELGQDGAGDP